MFLRIKIATDSNARHRVRVEQTFDEEPCFQRLPLSFLGGKELPLHECPAGVGGRCPIPLNGNRTRRTKMQIDEVEWRAVWSRDARIKERPVPSNLYRSLRHRTFSRWSPAPFRDDVVKHLLVDDRPAARNNEIVDIRWRVCSWPHARCAMVSLIRSAGKESIEGEKTSSIVIRRFLCVNFLQAKNIRREFAQYGFENAKTTLESAIVDGCAVKIFKIECRKTKRGEHFYKPSFRLEARQLAGKRRLSSSCDAFASHGSCFGWRAGFFGLLIGLLSPPIHSGDQESPGRTRRVPDQRSPVVHAFSRTWIVRSHPRRADDLAGSGRNCRHPSRGHSPGNTKTKAAVAFREGLESRPNSRCAESSHTILIIVAGVRYPSGVTSVNAG